jgi:hypothetical protein
MTITYVLPPVRNDPLPAPTEYGVWQPATDLRGLADSLMVSNATAQIDDIKSIPDAWAQAQLFGQALLSPDHELHHAVLAQWRGLLALFALQPLFANDYDLDIRSSRLSDHANGARRLRRVLHNLLPSVTLASGVDWDEAHVVLFHDRSAGPFSTSPPFPIGQLSPATLVFAGRNASKLSHPHVPWLTNGLADPTTVDGLSPDHYSVLARYTAAIAQMLQATDARERDHDRFGVFIKLLQDFNQAARARISGAPAALTSVEPHRGWPRAPFYAVLGQTWTVDHSQIPVGDSWALLEPRAEMAGAVNGIILVDPELSQTIGARPEAIRIWGRYTLRDAMTPAGLAVIKEEARIQGYLVVGPGDFFTSLFVKLNGDVVTVPAHPGRFRGALLPLSPLALMLMDRAALVEGLDVTTRGQDQEVTLSIPLAYDERRPRVRRHVVSRTFSGDEVIEAETGDDLSLWPNFDSPDWPWRYMHYQLHPRYYLKPRFGLSARFLKAEIQSRARAPQERVRVTADWISSQALLPEKALFGDRITELRGADGKLLLHRLRFEEEPDNVGEMHRLSMGVEAIFFATPDPSSSGDSLPAGCVLLQYEPMQQGPSTAMVSIDFGTTNSVAYTRRNDNLAPITFKNRLVFPVRNGREDGATADELVWAYTEFLPLTDVATPFPTVVRARSFRGSPPRGFPTLVKGGHEAHGFSDNIFFPPPENRANAARIIDVHEKGLLLFEIKWTRDENKRMLVKRYLRQFMFMAAAELVADGVRPADIIWRFSYPQAFTASAKRNLETYMRAAWSSIFAEIPGMEAADVSTYVASETEGQAALRYFSFDPQQKQAIRGDLMVVLDIGGGTTDIAVSHQGIIRWRDSFQVAGGHFFTRYLANNGEILRKIGLESTADSLSDDSSLDQNSNKNLVELFISSPGFKPRFDAAYPAFADMPLGLGLRDCASVALGGLMHYVGLVLGGFVRSGKLTKDDFDTVTIAFGGRGAAFFRQFAHGAPGDTDLARLCGVLVRAADVGVAPEDVSIETLFSNQAKHEVARGLLLDGPQEVEGDRRSRRARSTLWPAAPLGEAARISSDGRDVTLAKDDALTALLAAESIKSVSIDGLSAFLKALKEEFGIDVSLKARGADRLIESEVIRSVRGTLARLGVDDRNEADTQPLEPPFITGLRTLIDLMNLPLTERDKKLLVRDSEI